MFFLVRDPIELNNSWKSALNNKYYTVYQGVTFTFYALNEGAIVPLFKASRIAIQRHIKIKGNANPYDPRDEIYFEKRLDHIMLNKLKEKDLLTLIFIRQDGRCINCNQKLTPQEGWNAHHLQPKYLGGKFRANNLVLLHPICHRQVHAQKIQFKLPSRSQSS